MSRTTKRDLLVIVLLLAGLGSAFSYPVNTWKHARRAHFTVSYCEETAHLVGRALAIAEETAAALAGWFGYEFSGRRISIVLADQVDEPNGWASGRDPLVFIDCRQAPSLFRGGTDWLRTVITHELSHVYSLRVLNPPVVVGVYAGATSTAEGFDVAASETFGLNALPMWFIEGMAQLGSWRLQADSRDPLREMLLRDALLTGRLLGPAEMARFEGTSRDYELAYNQGFSSCCISRSGTGRRSCAASAGGCAGSAWNRRCRPPTGSPSRRCTGSGGAGWRSAGAGARRGAAGSRCSTAAARWSWSWPPPAPGSTCWPTGATTTTASACSAAGRTDATGRRPATAGRC